MRLVWSAQALEDLQQVREYIAADSQGAAARTARRLRDAAKLLVSHPEIGRAGRVSSTRELVVSGTPYLLPYRMHRGQIEILAILHSARRWPDNFV